ncbi:MAG: hypothetical protein ACM3QX_16150 [Syntrophomonadaceae bacterium]
MQSKLVCEEFEKKMWQFMDNGLNEEEMLFWGKHVRECALCSTRLLETKEVLALYDNLPMEDMEEETFTRMINKAVKKKRIFSINFRVPDFLYELSSDGFIKKFAFGSAAFAAVMVILFFMYKPAGNLPLAKKYISPESESVPQASQNIAAKEPSGTVRKSEVIPVKYEWKDKRTAVTIRHVGASLARIRVKKHNFRTPDDWVLQAMVLKRKMEFLKTDLDKSAM